MCVSCWLCAIEKHHGDAMRKNGFRSLSCVHDVLSETSILTSRRVADGMNVYLCMCERMCDKHRQRAHSACVRVDCASV